MSDSSIVIIQGTVGLYTVATRCHTCFAVILKYTEDSSLTILRHSLLPLATAIQNKEESKLGFLMLDFPQVVPYKLSERNKNGC